MNLKRLREIQTNEVLRRRLAKFIALQCFRNTDVLEKLHSGEVPISRSGDYSDVRVITPGGEIPWSELSRLDNGEMKAMMIEAVDHCDQLLAILFCTPLGDELIDELGRRDLVPDYEPQVARDPPMKRLPAERRPKRRGTKKTRRRSVRN